MSVFLTALTLQNDAKEDIELPSGKLMRAFGHAGKRRDVAVEVGFLQAFFVVLALIGFEPFGVFKRFISTCS
jgi:hypothetical protein